MTCPRCNNSLAEVSEYYNFEQKIMNRDLYCSFCKAGLTETFYENGKYSSEWIDFNA